MGVCQGVAHDSLQNGTGKGQINAHQRPHYSAGHADIPNNLALGVRPGMQQKLHDLGHGYHAGALGQAQKGTQHCQKSKKY